MNWIDFDVVDWDDVDENRVEACSTSTTCTRAGRGEGKVVVKMPSYENGQS